MLTLLFIVFAILSFSFLVMTIKAPRQGPWKEKPAELVIPTWIFGIVTIVLFIWWFICLTDVCTAYSIDSKIEMYQEENAILEKKH